MNSATGIRETFKGLLRRLLECPPPTYVHPQVLRGLEWEPVEEKESRGVVQRQERGFV